MADYEFRYSPLTGRLTGKQMIEQTEQAINQLSALVDSAAGQVEIISTLANEANENAATALETAEEALATTGRTYITVSTQTDANSYYDSQLIYIADSTSTNIPVADTGMLEVKTNDNKTACEQVFISDSSGDAYYRNGDIAAETVGDVTTYTVTWGGWSSQPASQVYVQQELTNYLPLSGGTVSEDLTVSGKLTAVASGNLPLAGGTMTGDIEFYDDLFLGSPADKTDPSQKSIFAGLYSNKNNPHDYGGIAFVNETVGTEQPKTIITAGNGTNRNYLTLYGNSAGGLSYNGVSFTDGTFITTRNVTTGLKPASGSSITAPAVSGYQFVCWVASTSNNAVVISYITPATSQTASLWYVGTAGNNVTFTCTALYVRKW